MKHENHPTPCLEWNATLRTCNASTRDSILDSRGERDLSQSLPPPPVPGATDARQRAENALTRGNRIRKSTLIPRLYPFRSICPLFRFLARLTSNRVHFVLLRFAFIQFLIFLVERREGMIFFDFVPILMRKQGVESKRKGNKSF